MEDPHKSRVDILPFLGCFNVTAHQGDYRRVDRKLEPDRFETSLIP